MPYTSFLKAAKDNDLPTVKGVLEDTAHKAAAVAAKGTVSAYTKHTSGVVLSCWGVTH